MSQTHHAFVSDHYSPRAADYVTSAVHSQGADLDQIEAAVRGAGEARVLDLGCGGGHVSYRVAPHVAAVVACDLSAAMLEEVTRTAAARGLGNITVRQGAAEKLPFADGEFDIVISRYSAHHWRDMEAGLREARRVLRDGGRAIFADSVAPAHPLLDSHLQAIELLRDVSHVRNYTIAQWTDALGRAGFSVGSLTARQVRMDYPVWIARTRASEIHAAAILSLQAGASAEVRRHFAVGEDGSFDLDTVVLEMAAA